MGRKLYEQNSEQGIRFVSSRRIGDVRIPNYVYDMWLPLIGAVGVGVYAVYCRLEREGSVKAMTLRRLAKMCRIGVNKLNEINDTLVKCQFITLKKPVGHKRLMHWTTEITVCDPPQYVSLEIITELQPPSGYEPLSPWLVTEAAEDPVGSSDGTNQVLDTDPVGAAKIASLGLHPLDVETESPSGDVSPEPVESFDDLFPLATEREDLATGKEKKGSILTHKDPLAMAAEVAKRRNGDVPDWAMNGDGPDPYWEPLKAFCTITHRPVAQMKGKTGKAWLRQFAKIGQEKEIDPALMEQTTKALPGVTGVKWLIDHNKWKTPYVTSYIEHIDLLACQMRAGMQVQQEGHIVIRDDWYTTARK